ncbi:unknown [Prevotella sp. CAG:592]|nr:unknown [Prevotella sp. CAG:592]
MVGTLDIIHDDGVLTSMVFFVFSKSSIYEALSCVPLACPAMSWANSPVKDICDGWVQWRNGILSSTLVSHWLSFFQLMLRPQRVLLSGSDPIDTFVVSACSDRCWKVPLSWKFLVKSYSQFSPSIVFRCCA